MGARRNPDHFNGVDLYVEQRLGRNLLSVIGPAEPKAVGKISGTIGEHIAAGYKKPQDRVAKGTIGLARIEKAGLQSGSWPASIGH